MPLHAQLGAALLSSRARFIALVGFALLVAVTGGSSRPDILTLIILRPASVLFCAYAFFAATGEQLREVRVPLIVVLALMLLALLQLVPLPQSVWASLPHRPLIAEASALIGLDGIARPLSLDPNRTWNTFFALFVPLGAIGLAAIQAKEWQGPTSLLLVAVGLLSALIAFLQAIGGNDLHFYHITHSGFPVGLFANKNHQSIMLLWLMLAGSWLAATADSRRHSASAAIAGALGAILVLFPLLVLTGSRAGLLLSVPTLLLCAWLLFRAPAMRKVLVRAGGRSKVAIGAVVAILFVPLLFVFGVLATSERKTALSRLFEDDVSGDVRWQYLSIYKHMMLDFLPFGSGFGSFENVFNLYEPSQMLTSRYMNQAHNDLVQIVIEGGLPAVAILAFALGWFVRSVWRVWRSSMPGARRLAVLLGWAIALWLLGSLVDYPIRTPLAAMLVAILTVWLSRLSTQRPSGSDPIGKAS